MQSFLNTILHLEEGSRIVELEFISPEELPDFGIGKKAVFDLKVKDEAGNYYVVEMQNRKEDSFLKRMQFYASSAYTNQARRGITHDGLMPVILIAIVNNQIFPDDVECVSYHQMLDVKTKQRFLFDVSYIFVELSKFHKKEEELKSLEDAWLYFLSCPHEAKAPPTTIKDETILGAFENVEQFNWTEAQYDAYIRAKLAEDADVITRKAEFGRGEVKGKIEGKIEVAKAMLSDGESIEKIIKFTGLPESEIKAMSKS
jgi:predicted transposase/invertase (TIGR01784 family)